MINKKRLLENLIRETPVKPLFEYNATELSNMSDSARKMRSSSMSAFYTGISQGQDGQAKTHWKVPSQSNRELHYLPIVEIVVPASGGLFGLAKGKWDPKKYSDILKKSDVKVYCNCPDFHWSGMAYNLGPNGKYKDSNVNASKSIIAPNIRDPERKNVLCKHLLTIIKVFPFNASDIFSSARKFDVQIETNPQITKDLDDGVKPLTKDVETISVTPEQKDVIMDSIQTAASNQLSKDVSPDGVDEIIQDENNDAIDAEIELTKDDGADELINEKNAEAQQSVVASPVDNTQDIINTKNQLDESNDVVDSVVSTTEVPVDEVVGIDDESDVLEKDKPEEESLANQNPSDVLGRN